METIGKQTKSSDESYEDSLLLFGNFLACTQSELAQTKSDLNHSQQHIAMLEEKIRWFEEQIKQNKQRRFGRQTETTESLQLLLPIFDKNEKDEATVTGEEEKETITYTRRKKSTGRKLDTKVAARACLS